ncbi:MAG TPA: response regulator [Micropepsaceae bacterium]|nr:response regulator [Micropepsaceae bacterium]
MNNNLAGRKIYIVDDDDAVRDSLRALLESLDFEVNDYNSAVDFLANPGADSTACLLLDLHMPVMNGLELLEHMQVNGPRLPTIVITGRGDSILRERALKSGAVALIDKPVADDTLLGAIDRAFATAS